MYNQGVLHRTGQGVAKDTVKAGQYYASAASLGHAKAMYNLGVFYTHGEGGMQQDWRRAASLFEVRMGKCFRVYSEFVGLRVNRRRVGVCACVCIQHGYAHVYIDSMWGLCLCTFAGV